MPKHLRGIFTKYDSNNYILNVPTKEMVFSYNKKDRKKLQSLLKEAGEWIPVLFDNTDFSEGTTKKSIMSRFFPSEIVTDKKIRAIGSTEKNVSCT